MIIQRNLTVGFHPIWLNDLLIESWYKFNEIGVVQVFPTSFLAVSNTECQFKPDLIQINLLFLMLEYPLSNDRLAFLYHYD